MNPQLNNEIAQLPSEAQHRIEDLRYQPAQSKLSDEGFVGLWSDHAEMQDSTEWVRHTRQSEWAKK